MSCKLNFQNYFLRACKCSVAFFLFLVPNANFDLVYTDVVI